MLYVTKKVSFSASHRLFNPTWDDKRNEEVFDKCNNINGHGHNYVLEVTVAGLPDPDTGYVIDLKKLKRIIKDNILDVVDHKHLNHDVEFFEGIITTVEHFAVKVWDILESKIDSGKLYKIKIFETEDSYVEYFGAPVDIKVFK